MFTRCEVTSEVNGRKLAWFVVKRASEADALELFEMALNEFSIAVSFHPEEQQENESMTRQQSRVLLDEKFTWDEALQFHEFLRKSGFPSKVREVRPPGLNEGSLTDTFLLFDDEIVDGRTDLQGYDFPFDAIAIVLQPILQG